jgi:hypothetical protein
MIDHTIYPEYRSLRLRGPSPRKVSELGMTRVFLSRAVTLEFKFLFKYATAS